MQPQKNQPKKNQPQSDRLSPGTGQDLVNARRGVLVLLLTVGAVLLFGDFDAPAPARDPEATTAGIALALAAIALRRIASSPTLRPKTAAFLALGALVSAAGLGPLGLGVALQTDSREAGLLFTLAGLIFALRAPSPAAPPGPN